MIPKAAKEELLNLCNILRTIWRHEDHGDKLSLFSHSKQEARVKTTASSEAERLPKTGKPIRGRKGVEVKVESQELPRGHLRAAELIEDAFTRPWSWNNQPDPLQNERDRLEAQTERLFVVLSEIPDLPERVFEFFGFKHYEPDELKKIAREVPPDDIVRPYIRRQILTKLLSESLDALGFQASNWQSFSDWETAVDNTLDKINDFASRQENQYDVIAFLNSPLVDTDDDISLGFVRLSEELTELFISHASDELLARLFDTPYMLSHKSSERIETVNSVLRYRTSVKCDAALESYLNVYREAAAVMGKVADVLRVVRDEDIGIQVLEVFEGRWGTPSIRKTYATTYQPEYDTFYPRRSYFIVETAESISVEQVELLKELIPPYLNNEIKLIGLQVAMQRFRDSQERYSPYDPQSLLDIVIAFEAVFLNDTDNTQELSYRLAMRVARFLGKDKEGRIMVFDLIRNLYKFRSKLAHGVTFDNLKETEVQKLKEVHEFAPIALRRALRKFLEGQGPLGLERQEIAEWWKKIELE